MPRDEIMKKCWKCQEKIKLVGGKYNRFIERSSHKKIVLHNDCYLEMTKDERKQILYDTKSGPPKDLRKNLKLVGFAIGGLAGGVGFSDGHFRGKMLGAKHLLKKKGMTMEELDDISIDRYGYNYPILPEKLQNVLTKELKE